MRPCSEEGFSLVEVMVALAIFAIALTGPAALMVRAMQANDQAQRMTAAVNLAQEKLEELRDMAPPTSGTDAVSEPNIGDYARVWTVGTGPTASSNTATITVTWTARGTQHVELSSVIRE